MTDLGLFINVTTNEKERTITIYDSGLGMSRNDCIENLGTIAKSGSQQFVKDMEEEQNDADSIIGQFGVGFYSSFIVADHVEVLTKRDDSSGVRWVSDGSGDYEISDAENIGFERGTKITVHLRPDSRIFSKRKEIDSIVRKYSMFISHPIKLDGEVINNLQAVWYREKREVTQEEYEKFYENIANTKIPHKYRLHYSTEVPLAIKALLYIPSTNSEKFGMQQEASHLHLYSRKVLIKQKCSELLPNYLRFVKGVVDCEDLPLNISRETYQDSNLMGKLKNVLTRRVLKLLEDEVRIDEERYNKWYGDFQNFIKEGLTMDQEHAEQLLKLTRHSVTYTDKLISLDDYVKKMKKDQNKIYFLVGGTKLRSSDNPFLEAFKGTNIPVLILETHIDEVCFRQANDYKGFKFVNIESQYEEIQKDIGKSVGVNKTTGIPETDITPFCLWMKAELEPAISKVTISKRLTGSPAVIIGQVSSSMRAMLQMVDQAQYQQATQNQTLEVNPNHEFVTKLNQIRKTDPKTATLLVKSLLDNVMSSTGIPFDIQNGIGRSYSLLNMLMDHRIQNTPASDDIKFEQADDDEPILRKGRAKTKDGKTVEIKVEDVINEKK